MKGFGKQVIAGLTVALFITTATCFVIYTVGFASNDQIAVTTVNSDGSLAATPPFPSVTPTYFPTPTPAPVPPVRLVPPPYQELQTAYDEAPDTSLIEILAGTLPGSLNASRPIDITIKGGFDTTFTTNSGITVMQGEFTLSNGSITVEQLGIQ